MRVLVVDDTKVFRTVLLIGLRNKIGRDHIYVPAENGNSALALFLDDPFDFVVTDLMMPNMDGIVLARQLIKKEKVDPRRVLVVSCMDPDSKTLGEDDTIVNALRRLGINIEKSFFSKTEGREVANRIAERIIKLQEEIKNGN